MPQTVEQWCQAIEQNQLIPAKDMMYLRNRWFRPGRKEVDQADKFTRWLVVNHFLTEFAVESLRQENTGILSFDPYKVSERLRTGPMAGALLATDNLSNRSVVIDVFSTGVGQNPGLFDAVQQVVQRAIEISHPYVGDLLDIRASYNLRFMVTAYESGETLADILYRRKRIPYLQAAKIFAMAFAGLQALHESNIPGGDLQADCLILTEAKAGKKGQRAVKILHAGIPRRFFDNAIPLDPSTALSLAVDAGGDIFRMGCLFYRSVTGQPPFAGADATTPAAPIRQDNPAIPAMLAEIIEETIDLDPARRPRKASGVAKTLRVFLASEEEDPDARPEENLATPEKVTQRIRRKEIAEGTVEGVAEETPKPTSTQDESGAEAAAKVPAETYRPRDRDLVFFAGGAVTLIVLIVLLHLATGWEMINLVCLLTGTTVTYLVHQFIRWRVNGTD